MRNILHYVACIIIFQHNEAVSLNFLNCSKTFFKSKMGLKKQKEKLRNLILLVKSDSVMTVAYDKILFSLNEAVEQLFR